ncbi:MAG: cytoplasmic protein [Rickettsiales bacterium]|nr:cytoplasmic protein [Rickettsiales bacterium]OUV53705.1 MAG: cytoplasmic protein [Rickettsiales bacterium TMED127]|tara:strand:+ start:5463 stop:5978 length:516 start_codon:yes stop_codon:yes gene_type:complete
MNKPLMPKATAIWLIENTTLTFKQIASFVGFHELEIQAIADGEVSVGVLSRNPIENGELSAEEIKICENNNDRELKLLKTNIPQPKTKTKGAKYTPLSKRADKPNGISWILKNLPNLPDSKTCKLIGTTKTTIKSIRDRSHWNSQNIRAQNPFELGFCTKDELEKLFEKYK